MTSATDTAWTDPGETFGTPDRHQSRVYLGLHLHAGNNHRKPDGTHVHCSTATPWSVSEWRGAEGVGQDYKPDRWVTIADGRAVSQGMARDLAEIAARNHRRPAPPADYVDHCLTGCGATDGRCRNTVRACND